MTLRATATGGLGLAPMLALSAGTNPYDPAQRALGAAGRGRATAGRTSIGGGDGTGGARYDGFDTDTRVRS